MRQDDLFTIIREQTNIIFIWSVLFFSVNCSSVKCTRAKHYRVEPCVSYIISLCTIIISIVLFGSIYFKLKRYKVIGSPESIIFRNFFLCVGVLSEEESWANKNVFFFLGGNRTPGKFYALYCREGVHQKSI